MLRVRRRREMSRGIGGGATYAWRRGWARLGDRLGRRARDVRGRGDVGGRHFFLEGGVHDRDFFGGGEWGGSVVFGEGM